MTLQHCNSEVQRNFYRELWSASQQPLALHSGPASQPEVATNRSLHWAGRALTVCLGAKALLAATSLAFEVTTQVSAYMNFQDVLIF